MNERFIGPRTREQELDRKMAIVGKYFERNRQRFLDGELTIQEAGETVQWLIEHT